MADSEQFYCLEEGKNYAFVQGKGVKPVFFNTNYLIGDSEKYLKDLTENYPVLTGKKMDEAKAIYEKVKGKQFLEREEGVDFFIDKESYEVFAVWGEDVFPVGSPKNKGVILDQRVKMKDFLKGIKKSKSTYKLGDRVLLYWPTGTGKTYNFLEFLKTAKIEYALVPVSNGMEDLDLLNYIVPTDKGVQYKPKEITELLEKAEKGQKVCIIFDELNRGSDSLMNLVLKALDPVDWVNYHITNVLQDKTYEIKQENIIWGATINLGGKYTGTNSLDEALFDRFNIVNFVGYDREVEKAIVSAAWFSSADANKIFEFLDSVRLFASDGEIRSPISTRGLKVWMEEYMNGGDLLQAFERTLMYRIISVDEFGIPNPQELEIVQGKYKKILLKS